MFNRKSKIKPEPVVTPAQEEEIILAYLKQCAASYKDQPITAERMIEMEIELIERRQQIR